MVSTEVVSSSRADGSGLTPRPGPEGTLKCPDFITKGGVRSSLQ
jgi:hypothetical protein